MDPEPSSAAFPANWTASIPGRRSGVEEAAIDGDLGAAIGVGTAIGVDRRR